MPPRQGMEFKQQLEDVVATPIKQSGIGRMANQLVTTGKEAVLTDNTKRLFINLLTTILSFGLILAVSIFTYCTFYFAYMPSEVVFPFKMRSNHCL